MFRPHHTYRHFNSLDVDMHVTKVQWGDKDRIKLKVAWVLRRNGEVIGLDRVTVKRKDSKNWEQV